MSENLSSLVVQHHSSSVEAILGSAILGEYPRVHYQGVIGTIYAGNEAFYFTGMSSYLFLERKEELLAWRNVQQILKWNEHGIEIVVSDTSRQDTSHVFTITDHVVERDKIWAFLTSLCDDILVDHAAMSQSTSKRTSLSRAGKSLKRTHSDPLMASSRSLQATHPSSSCLDGDPKTKNPGDGPRDVIDQGDQSDMSTSKSASMYLDQALPKQAAIVTTDANSIELSIGKIALQPISCQYNGVDGKLYAGQAAIYFVGHRFFFWGKQEELLPWDSIHRIALVEATDLASDQAARAGIRVVTKIGDERVYTFGGIVNASKVVASLQCIQNEFLGCPTSQSDPPSQTDTNDSIGSSTGMPNTVLQAPAKPEELIITPERHIDHEENWTRDTQENRFPTQVITDHILDCDLETFDEVFLRDDAKHSYAKFLASRGDSNLRTTPWEDHGLNYTRTISYTHPINAPMAPPQADARKEQTLRRYGKLGLVLETKTIVQDLPMTDGFYVTDRVLVEAREEKVAVTIEFQLVFIKSNIFKGIISRTTTSECTLLFQELKEYLSEAHAYVMPTAAEKPVIAARPVARTYWQSLLRQPLLPFVVSIAVLQLFIIRDVRRTQASVKLVEASLEQILQLQLVSAASCAANGASPR